ncbi:DUF2520 domain-containing protein [bacterium AH-315-B15]|nr:DUF2520 domain-containing protein [bacterium AH-315-B15]
MINKINIIGSGRVANKLALYLSQTTEILSIHSLEPDRLRNLAQIINAKAVSDVRELSSDAELNLIAVSDDQIEDVAKGLNRQVPVVHTSGSVTLDVFEGFDYAGILYPLQTFSVDRVIDISKIPFLIESNNIEFMERLKEFTSSRLSSNMYEVDSDKRSRIHVAAVFAANFANHLWSISEDILRKEGIELDLFEPLIIESIQKAMVEGCAPSQTGPAVRGDENTINQQLETLDGMDKEIYQLMTLAIQEKFNLSK